MRKKTKPKFLSTPDFDQELCVEMPVSIYVVVQDNNYEGYGEPLVASLEQIYAERMAKKAGEGYCTVEIKLVSIPEEWEGWPTNPANIKKRALAKLTPEERKALGF